MYRIKYIEFKKETNYTEITYQNIKNSKFIDPLKSIKDPWPNV